MFSFNFFPRSTQNIAFSLNTKTLPNDIWNSSICRFLSIREIQSLRSANLHLSKTIPNQSPHSISINDECIFDRSLATIKTKPNWYELNIGLVANHANDFVTLLQLNPNSFSQFNTKQIKQILIHQLDSGITKVDIPEIIKITYTGIDMGTHLESLTIKNLTAGNYAYFSIKAPHCHINKNVFIKNLLPDIKIEGCTHIHRLYIKTLHKHALVSLYELYCDVLVIENMQSKSQLHGQDPKSYDTIAIQPKTIIIKHAASRSKIHLCKTIKGRIEEISFDPKKIEDFSVLNGLQQIKSQLPLRQNSRHIVTYVKNLIDGFLNNPTLFGTLFIASLIIKFSQLLLTK